MTGLDTDNWVWRQIISGGVHYSYFDLMDGETVLAWIDENSNCPNSHLGHWHSDIRIELGSQYGFPRYYMNLERAKAEIFEFLNWRLNKIRAEQ